MKKQRNLKKVQDLMTSHVVGIPPSTPFKEIVQRFRRSRIGAIPVTDVFGRVVGLVSETDLLPKEEPSDILDRHFFDTKSRRQLLRKAMAFTASDLMTTPALTIGPDASLKEAARLLVENYVNQLAVVDAARAPVGIVSRRDVLQVFMRDEESIREEVIKDVIERTLQLDSHDIQVTVEGGIVMLKGQLELRSAVQHLVAEAQAVDGVVGVIDRLSYRWDDTNLYPVEQAVLAPFSSSWGGRTPTEY